MELQSTNKETDSLAKHQECRIQRDDLLGRLNVCNSGLKAEDRTTYFIQEKKSLLGCALEFLMCSSLTQGSSQQIEIFSLLCPKVTLQPQLLVILVKQRILPEGSAQLLFSLLLVESNASGLLHCQSPLEKLPCSRVCISVLHFKVSSVSIPGGKQSLKPVGEEPVLQLAALFSWLKLCEYSSKVQDLERCHPNFPR